MGNIVPYPEFDTFFRLHHRIRTAIDEGLAPHGITLTSLQVLVTIKAQSKPYNHCTRMTIATALGLTRGTLSTLVKLLLEKNLVVERLDSRWIDARRKQLQLTAAGTRTMHKGLVVRSDVLDLALGSVSAPLHRSFLDAIDLMNNSLAGTDASFKD